MKVINTIVLSALVALGSATAQADTSSAPVLLSNAQLDVVDAGSRYRYSRHYRPTSASASAGGEVRVRGVVYANGGADSSASGGRTSTAGAEGGAAALGVRFNSGGRKGGSVWAGAGIAGGSSYSCSGHCN